MDTVDHRASIFREQRAAKSQSLFRDVNERIEPLNKGFRVIDQTSVSRTPDLRKYVGLV